MSLSVFIVLLFFALFMCVPVWFVLANRFFKLLRTRHSETYEAIGSPTLILNNSIMNSWLSLRFLLKGQWRGLDDPEVARLGKFMRAFFLLYSIALGILFVGLMWEWYL